MTHAAERMVREDAYELPRDPYHPPRENGGEQEQRSRSKSNSRLKPGPQTKIVGLPGQLCWEELLMAADPVRQLFHLADVFERDGRATQAKGELDVTLKLFERGNLIAEGAGMIECANRLRAMLKVLWPKMNLNREAREVTTP